MEVTSKKEVGRVHLELVVTVVGPLPSTGVSTSPHEGRWPPSMTNPGFTRRSPPSASAVGVTRPLG